MRGDSTAAGLFLSSAAVSHRWFRLGYNTPSCGSIPQSVTNPERGIQHTLCVYLQFFSRLCGDPAEWWDPLYYRLTSGMSVLPRRKSTETSKNSEILKQVARDMSLPDESLFIVFFPRSQASRRFRTDTLLCSAVNLILSATVCGLYTISPLSICRTVQFPLSRGQITENPLTFPFRGDIISTSTKPDTPLPKSRSDLMANITRHSCHALVQVQSG